ncbi:MAG: two-component system response regulator [Polaromonas sp.]|nr:two-component system response regulator [Polaromonas sp.]
MTPPAASILLVEDNADEADLTRIALTRYGQGNPVEHVSDGQQALDYLFRRGRYTGRTGNDPLVVLLDLKMPVRDGFDVLREVKTSEHLRHTPIVVLTSSAEPADLQRAYASGSNAYVAKPTDFADFLSTMKQVCDFWLRANQTVPQPTH